MDPSMMNHSMHHHPTEAASTTMSPMHNHNHNHMGGGMMTTMSGAGGAGGGTHMHGMGGMGGMDGMHHMDNMSMHDMMKMYFHTGNVAYVLFESCKTENDTDMVIACIVIFLVAVFYEGLKFVREILLQRNLMEQTVGDGAMAYPDNKYAVGASASQERMVVRGTNRSISSQMLSSHHAIQTFLHVVQIFVSYCLMLVFMTYNVWLCLAVVLGVGLGYFAFGWKRASVVDANEHCH